MRKRLISTCLLAIAVLIVMRSRAPRPQGPIALAGQVAAPTIARTVSTSPVGSRTPHAPPKPGETRVLTIKELGNFEYDAGAAGTIPADVRELDGMTVRLIGFMIPMGESDQVTRFALAPSLFSCCYGQPPSIQHIIIVECAPGKSVAYISSLVAVEGKLNVGEFKESGSVICLFHLACTSAKPIAS